MKLAKDLISYYMDTCGKSYDDFYSQIGVAVATENPTGEIWLIKKMLEMLEDKGTTIDMLIANKDTVRAVADGDKRKQEGEFYTPEIWCSEGRTYFDKYIEGWKDYNVWDASCGTGNLMRTSGHAGDKLFLSTLRSEDAETVQGTFPDATVFALDFLKDIDYDDSNLEFFNKLPKRLQEIIANDEPLIFYMNPPYKVGSAKATDVGVHMTALGLGRSAVDIFYQFIWRVTSLVERFNLKNTWFEVFGPLTFFTSDAYSPLLAEFEHCFEFIDGMCLSAQEFSDTSSTIMWGIGCTLWKSRGGYQPEGIHRDILLEKKFRLPDGTIENRGRTLYAPPRTRLSEWVVPNDVVRYEIAPCATSFNNFKEDASGNIVVGKRSSNSLGSLMTGNTLTRAASQSAILTLPTTISFVDITKENFWRCVASFAVRRLLVVQSWVIAKKELSAPLTHIEGYEKWLYNALILVPFEFKALQSGLRNVKFNGAILNVPNNLFFLSQDLVKASTTDPVILQDIEENKPTNQFFLDQIEKAKPYWEDCVKDMFDFGKNWLLSSLDARSSINYKESTNAWDAGFAQIRATLWNDELEKELSRHMSKVRDYLRADMMKFGFIEESSGSF